MKTTKPSFNVLADPKKIRNESPVQVSAMMKRLDKVLSSNELDFSEFKSTLIALYHFKDTGVFKEAMIELRKHNEVISTGCTMQGRAFEKKYGYAGDFEIIDKIYTEYISENKLYAMWDRYFHEQPAPIAVRNRKKYFISKMSKLYKDMDIRVLNLASGPCRDILELLNLYDQPKFEFDCVELDKNAIEYARKLLDEHKSQIKFINKNIFRFTPTKNYDVIWSAGLFDYFDDKTFVRILKRILDSNPNSKIIIGNFSDENPTMPYMELIGEWFLHYRGKDRLRHLALQAGANSKSICIESESENVNLFLNIN